MAVSHRARMPQAATATPTTRAELEDHSTELIER